jgi:hypothetical protein
VRKVVLPEENDALYGIKILLLAFRELVASERRGAVARQIDTLQFRMIVANS